MQTIDFMPDRLNAEPTVFRGFTTHEMFAAAGVGCVGGSVISIPLLPLAGWVILPTGALIMPLLVVFFGGTFLTRIKRGKPENYLYRRLSWKLQTGFARTLPLPTVYAFSFYIFQQLNAWPKDGEVDYPRKIAQLSAYLTPSCRAYFEKEAAYRTTLGELKGRSRVVYEIPGRGFSEDKVRVIDRDNWIVRLDLVADEYFSAEPVKRATVRYPVKVVRWEGDPESNPFGLALDCYDGLPQRLEAAEQNKEVSQ